MSYPVSSTPGVFIDHAALSAMSDRVNRPGVRAVASRDVVEIWSP